MARWVGQQALFLPGFGFSYCLSSFAALPWYWSITWKCKLQQALSYPILLLDSMLHPSNGKTSWTCYKMSSSHFYPLFFSFNLFPHHCRLQIKIIETRGPCAIQKLHLKKLKKKSKVNSNEISRSHFYLILNQDGS